MFPIIPKGLDEKPLPFSQTVRFERKRTYSEVLDVLRDAHCDIHRGRVCVEEREKLRLERV